MPSAVLVLSVGGSAGGRITRLLESRGFAVTPETDLAEAVAAAPGHSLVVVDAADSARVVALLKRVRRQVGAQPPILAVAHGHEVEERVGLLEAGADDVLAQPFDERELEALVEALLLRSTTALALPDGRTATPVTSGVPISRGELFVFAAAKGGSGTTTLAVNVALALAARPEADVAIVDLDFYHGQVALHLDLKGEISTAQLARQNHEDAGELLTAAAAAHASGLLVFPAPHRADEATQVTPVDVRRLIDALRRRHAHVVVDAGTAVDARSLALLQMADRVVLAVTPEIPALRTLHGLLEVLADTGAIGDRTTFVLNQIYPKPMLSPEQIQENLGVKFSLQIPYHDRLYVTAVNEGRPLITAAPKTAQADRMRQLAGLLAPEDEPLDEPSRRRGLAGLRRRR